VRGLVFINFILFPIYNYPSKGKNLEGEDIRSENADMSNDKSCEKHDRQKFKGFYVQ
jgi:hypothetical protein